MVSPSEAPREGLWDLHPNSSSFSLGVAVGAAWLSTQMRRDTAQNCRWAVGGVCEQPPTHNPLQSTKVKEEGCLSQPWW